MENKKSILFVLPGFNFGGTVFSTLNMISFLQQTGRYDIYVFSMTHQGPVKKYYDDVNVLPENICLSALMAHWYKEKSYKRKMIYFPIKVLRKLFSILGFDYSLYVYDCCVKRIQSQYHFDYVASCQEGAATIFVSYFTNCKRIAWSRTEYSIYKTQLTQSKLQLELSVLNLMDQIVCVSKTTRDDLCNSVKELAKKTVAIHNIQNVENIRLQAKKVIRDSFDDSFFNIVSIGRIAPQKRFDKIPFIAKQLKDMGLSFRWYIIGDGNMEGANDKLQKELNKFMVRDCVICCGSRLNPYPYIASANLLVLPSSYEACPRVVIEAKILKTPVVCANFSSAKEFVKDSVDGFVESIDNLFEPIGRMISDRNLYCQIKKECDKYEIDNNLILNQLLSVFN